MAPQLVFDSEVKDPEPERARHLCFEDGDRIIALTSNPFNHFVLNSEVLSRTSIFFEPSEKSVWSGFSKQVQHPETKQDIRVVTYYLDYDNLNWTISLTQREPGWPLEDQIESGAIDSFQVFHVSKCADGYVRRNGLHRYVDFAGLQEGRRCPYKYLERVRSSHKVMFELLYSEQIDDEIRVDDFESFAEIAAYAEAYDLFDAIAPKLKTLLLKMAESDGLWADVKDNCMFHLALAQKLRCEEIFVDAMRHFIGSGLDLELLIRKVGLDGNYAFKIARVRDHQKKRIEVLTEDVLALTLTTHVPDDGVNGIDPGKPVKTSFFSSAHTPTHGEEVLSIARHIFMQWLNHQRLGEKHWSYLREEPELVEVWDPWDSTPSDDGSPQPRAHTHGVHAPSSFRYACASAVRASQTDKELTLFDLNVAEAFVRASSLSNSPYTTLEVQEELKKLVNKMAWLAMPLLAQPDFALVSSSDSGIERKLRYHNAAEDARDSEETDPDFWKPENGPGTVREGTFGYAHTFINEELKDRNGYDRKQRNDTCGSEKYGMTALYEHDIHYFTATKIGEGQLDMPWVGKKDTFKTYKIHGLKPASKKWLQALEVWNPADDIYEGTWDG